MHTNIFMIGTNVAVTRPGCERKPVVYVKIPPSIQAQWPEQLRRHVTSLFKTYNCNNFYFKRTICTKINTYATVLPSASLSSRLLVQRPRVYPQFFQPSAFRHYATKSRKHAKPVPKSANSGKSNLVVQNIKENLPGVDNQPRLLDRLRAAGAVSDLQAPEFVPCTYSRYICFPSRVPGWP